MGETYAQRARRRQMRRDYEDSMPKPMGRQAFTSLSFGLLFPLVDQDAELCVTMVNRAMTPAEWDSYSRSPAATRKRRQMTLQQRIDAEIKEDGRLSDETMERLQRGGQ